MNKHDIELTCIQCGQKFIFTKAEQQQWSKRGFVHYPKRCKKCREERRKKAQEYYGIYNGSYMNEYRSPAFRNEQKNYQSIYRSPMDSAKIIHKGYEIICARCGQSDVIPFKPPAGRQVFCHDCYEAIKLEEKSKNNEIKAGTGEENRMGNGIENENSEQMPTEDEELSLKEQKSQEKNR
jgi:CxxC-x17-CxxC domain-containing protein